MNVSASALSFPVPRSISKALPLRGTLVIALCVFGASCGGCPPGGVDAGVEAEPEPPPVLALDVALDDDEVRCGLVNQDSELIGGPSAYGRVGRVFRCYNSKIRFLVQDNVDPIGSSAEGGTLIDIDLVREDETADGSDAFRELILATGAEEISVESIAVVDDGSTGEQAILRIEGHPAPLSVAPQAAYLSQGLPALIRHEFVLRPNSPVLEIRTTIINESDEQLYYPLFVDVVAFGGALLAHNPVSGFEPAAQFSTTPWIAFGAKSDVSYAFWCSDRDATLPFDSFGVKVSICSDDLIVVRDLIYSRFFGVGDGTLDSVSRLAMEGRGIGYGTVNGTVSRGGEPAPLGTQVFALDRETLEDAVVVSQTVTDADGGYELALMPGEYYVLASVEVGSRSVPQVIVVDVDSDATVDATVPAVGSLSVTTTFADLAGADTAVRPSKISIQALGGGARPEVALGEEDLGQLWGAFPTVDGALEVALPPGQYRVFVTRGFTYSRFEVDIEVTAGNTTTVAANIGRVIDTSGLIATEFHQHTLGSLDGSVPPEVRVLENAAEGVRFAASTDHDNIVDFDPLVERLGLRPWLRVIPGDEVSYQGIGHFNVFPWNIDPEAPYADIGVKVWWQKTAPELFASVRARAGDPIVQINHPRGGTAAFFAAMRLDPTNATRVPREPAELATLPPNIYAEWSSDFEAVEVDGDFGDPSQFRPEFDAEMARRAAGSPGDIPALADYLALLGAGLHVSGMGNSDSHHFNEGMGYPRSYARIDSDLLDDATPERIKEAIRGQRVSIANGCVIEVLRGTERPMGHAEAIDSGAGLSVRVQAPLHADVDTLEMYVNGRAQFVTLDAAGFNLVAEADGTLQAPVTLRDEVTRVNAAVNGLPGGDDDLLVLFAARGAGGLAPTGSNRVYCLSAPLYIDRGAPGFIGWHAATQEIQ